MKAQRKGISPLIAAVLLIAFTMAIAGIMASWATTFSSSRLSTAQTQSECIGALDISSLRFDNGTVSVKIRNTNEVINLTALHAILEYGDARKNRDYTLSSYNVTDPLPPAATTFLILSTNETARPEKLELVAGNCPDHSAILFFR